MNEDQLIGIVAIVCAMVLVGSGLARRKLQGSRALVMVIIWVGLIGLAWAAATIGLRLAR